MGVWARDMSFISNRMSRFRGQPIGQILLEWGAISIEDLAYAAALRQRHDTRIGQILLAHGLVGETVLYEALAAQFGAGVAHLERLPPDRAMVSKYGAHHCLRDGLIPWRRLGDLTLIATARPEQFEARRPYLQRLFGKVEMAITPEHHIHASIMHSHQHELARLSETRVPAHESCRPTGRHKTRLLATFLMSAIIAVAVIWPFHTLKYVTFLAVVMLLVISASRVMGIVSKLHGTQIEQTHFHTMRPRAPLPIISIIVPLYKERAIAQRLLKRLERLTYPRELLDICLAVESDDIVTRDALSQEPLPRWMRQIIVPQGAIRTKPRALNYTLDFCKGSIVGIYDAEDAPAPDQLEKVAARFAAAGPNTACLQGILDYYNASTNWIARCFTIEYATWFRLLLPGLARAGFIIPLGGTTLFFRRNALEKLGGWDAYNVTEDADLGVRLARHGYRTEMIDTVTEEEANCHPWPWIKQRSRWLKGFAITYGVHMRAPRQLLRDLGMWQFLSLQVLFLAPLITVMLAPVLLSFWLLPLGLAHPLDGMLSRGAWIFTLGGLAVSALVYVVATFIAVQSAQKKGLWKWIPALQFYLPLASIAALKALFELLIAPYYWDKTTHGLHDQGHHARVKPPTSPNPATVAPFLLSAHARINDAPRPRTLGVTPTVEHKEWAFHEETAAFDFAATPVDAVTALSRRAVTRHNLALFELAF